MADVSRLIVTAAVVWLAWVWVVATWLIWVTYRTDRSYRRRAAAQHLLVPPTHRLPVPTPAELDRLWAMVRDARDGDVR